MSEPAAQAQEVVCPHCGKPFEGGLLSVGTRHEGFKCPHCQLVVPVDRVAADGRASSPS